MYVEAGFSLFPITTIFLEVGLSAIVPESQLQSVACFQCSVAAMTYFSSLLTSVHNVLKFVFTWVFKGFVILRQDEIFQVSAQETCCGSQAKLNSDRRGNDGLKNAL